MSSLPAYVPRGPRSQTAASRPPAPAKSQKLDSPPDPEQSGVAHKSSLESPPPSSLEPSLNHKRGKERLLSGVVDTGFGSADDKTQGPGLHSTPPAATLAQDQSLTQLSTPNLSDNLPPESHKGGGTEVEFDDTGLYGASTGLQQIGKESGSHLRHQEQLGTRSSLISNLKDVTTFGSDQSTGASQMVSQSSSNQVGEIQPSRVAQMPLSQRFVGVGYSTGIRMPSQSTSFWERSQFSEELANIKKTSKSQHAKSSSAIPEEAPRFWDQIRLRLEDDSGFRVITFDEAKRRLGAEVPNGSESWNGTRRWCEDLIRMQQKVKANQQLWIIFTAFAVQTVLNLNFTHSDYELLGSDFLSEFDGLAIFLMTWARVYQSNRVLLNAVVLVNKASRRLPGQQLSQVHKEAEEILRMYENINRVLQDLLRQTEMSSPLYSYTSWMAELSASTRGQLYEYMSDQGPVDPPPRLSAFERARDAFESLWERLSLNFISLYLSGDSDYEKSVVSNVKNWTGYITPDGEQIGEGGFGKVFRGKWENLTGSDIVTPPVVIKILQVTVAKTAKELKERKSRFRYLAREVEVWQRLRHDNIVPFVGVVDLPDCSPLPSLISKWMTHGTVIEYREQNPNAPILPLLVGAARGLKYLHRVFTPLAVKPYRSERRTSVHNPKIIHGDLAARNVLVNDDLQACLVDFGLSHVDEKQPLFVTARVQAPGHVRWLPPELVKGTGITFDEKSDIYSYAMTAIEMHTLRAPFDHIKKDPEVVMLVHYGVEVPKQPEEVPKGLWDIIEPCWERDATGRPVISQIVESLGAVLTD